MNEQASADIAFFFGTYSMLLWLAVLVFAAILYSYMQPFIAGLRGDKGASWHRRVCPRSALFLAFFCLSPVIASVLNLPFETTFVFALAFVSLSFILKRHQAQWPLIAFLLLIGVQLILDIVFFVAAFEHVEAFSGLFDLLLFRGDAEPLSNAAHVFFLLPADIVILFHGAKTLVDLGGLIPVLAAMREGKHE